MKNISHKLEIIRLHKILNFSNHKRSSKRRESAIKKYHIEEITRKKLQKCIKQCNGYLNMNSFNRCMTKPMKAFKTETKDKLGKCCQKLKQNEEQSLLVKEVQK